jgi:cytochrome P450
MSKKSEESSCEGWSGIDFNSSGFRTNPHKTYEYMRRFKPVCMIKPDDMWAISRAADVEYVLSNPQIFSSTGINLAYDSEWLSSKCRAPRLILCQDPPDHRKYRQIITDVFSRESITSLEPLMQRAARSQLVNFSGNSSVDFVQQFAYPYIGQIMRYLIGLNET